MASQELPPIANYSTDDYGAGNQNWSITQGDNNYIYIANHKGLLEFDGAQWTLYPTPNQTIIRSVKAVGNRIYSGCYMEFGYWKHDSSGVLVYTNLSEQLDIELIEDEQFWNIIALDEFVAFQSLNRIYVYNTLEGTLNTINTSTTLTKMYSIDDTIYFQEIYFGIYRIVDGKSTLVTDSAIAKNSEIVNMFQINGDILVLTQKDGLYHLEEGELKEAVINSSGSFENYTIYSSLMLRNGTIAIGTISNGVVIIKPDGTLVEAIDLKEGLSNNTVLSLFEDRQNNLWLGLDNGIDCLNLGSPIRKFQDIEGKIGTVYACVVYKDNLYIGTNQGLFSKPYQSKGNFNLIGGTNGQVWCLKVLNDQLFAGHNMGTFQIMDGTAELIANIPGTWDVQLIEDYPDLLIQGNFSGLHILQKSDDGVSWSYRNKLQGFDNSSRYFEQNDSEIFVSHEYKGVYRIKADQKYRKALDVHRLEQLSKGKHAGLQKFQDSIIYSSPQGIFIYHPEKKDFIRNSFYSKMIDSLGYTSGKLISDEKSERLWSFNQTGLKYLEIESLSGKPEIDSLPISFQVRKEMTGFECLTHLENSKYLIGSSKGYLIFDLNQFEDLKYDVKINRIEMSQSGTPNQYIPLDVSADFNNSLTSVKFHYSVPEYNHFSQSEYQYRLKGLYDDWSGWSSQSTEEFKNLRFGDYKFEVKGRIGHTLSDNIASFEFSVAKPWYLRNVMIGLYIVGVILFSVFMHHFYERYYKRQRQKLMNKKQREFELKTLASEKELMKLKNEKLLQDIENKNRELAISTMSLIKKNEFLSDIKKRLRDEEKDKNLNGVINVIDKNLNNSDDWKFFEEAFNNADKDFLKKVKTKHPELTSNDLKLCAYLRLNLSSKEIAPLLNISPRSVEVKRYRLRKKMSLPHETNLTDYILEI